ncbi:TetR/AcrR family transcriptional regulator [Gluconobacter aidae]|uniref:TetR family transcriptional regulator n=1 Tax=Gluconobacter aidae TaxID=2662454 RepID=A0A7X1SRK8_9PROT|nr:TetR/AcrR family transcriptional regulator [Gluconobacter aidae]MQR99054.1 TetR family transcriptional regulator [Gluconobacter aidae]
MPLEKSRASSSTKKRVRDAEATKLRILEAAKKEFARNGLEGARVDTIALDAKANKRMLYHYFKSKDGLFRTLLEREYLNIREEETKLNLENLPPRTALETLVRFTWEYYIANPEFITLVNSENLCQAVHIRNSPTLKTISQKFIRRIQSLLDRGVRENIFREGIDAAQLNITIASINYYYFTNRFTGSVIFERDFTAPEALKERIAFNIETICRLVCKN